MLTEELYLLLVEARARAYSAGRSGPYISHEHRELVESNLGGERGLSIPSEDSQVSFPRAR